MKRLLLALLLGLLVLPTALPASVRAQSSQTQIRLNQIGFYPDAPKAAVVAGASAGPFYVATPDLADTVFTGTLGTEKTWSPSGERVRLADFTGMQAEGTYVVTVPGLGPSYPFEIEAAVHEGVARAAIKGFYYQRASTRLFPQHADRWARPAGHPDTVVYVHPSAASPERPAGTVLSAPRGWYDAGDYNKYLVNSGITTGTLLMLYEHYPAYFDALELNIPESGDGVPDLLDEILWNVRWMLAMQDPNDGGVYTKLTDPNFDGMQLPHRANQMRYVVQKSTAATLDFAAVTALAARVVDDFEAELPGLADSLLAASRDAWDWALNNQEVPYDQGAMNAQFDPDINTGGYGDGSFFDEFRWAAAELFVTTGDPFYLAAFDPTNQNAGVPGWPNVGSLGLFSLAHHREQVASAIDTAAVTGKIVTAANQLVNLRLSSAFDMPFGLTGDFYWGSNSGAANQGFVLLQAYDLTGDARYRDAALANLDYLLGRNGIGWSFLTGYGDRTPKHPHHRPSEGDVIVDPVPGLLVGGPNPDAPRQGETCPGYMGTLPGTTYTDDVCSYATNEIAINWNAPMAYLAGALEAIFSPTGLPTAVDETPVRPQPGRRGIDLSSYPNPFNERSQATFELPAAGPVSLVVYDLLGRVVARPLHRAYLPAGRHQIPLDGRILASGTYVLRLTAGETVTSRLVVVAK